MDKAPRQAYATLLDEGTYLCHWRTMYRVLAVYDEVRERRHLRRHPAYKKPELLATQSNEVWSWDITALRGPHKWEHYRLYTVLDIFSRYVGKASGTTTADANPDPQKAKFRQRPLLTVDEVVTPQIGNCTIFARFVEPAFATQVILTARLTRLYEREDWQNYFAGSKNEEPLLLERGVSVNVQPTFTQSEPPKLSKKVNQDSFAQAAKQRMAEAKTGKSKMDDGQPTMTDIRTMKRRAQQQRQTAKAQMEGDDVTRKK